MARITYTPEGTPTIPLPSVRGVARALGAKAYFTGAPCKYGHTAHRYAATGQCSACAAISVADRLKKNGPPTIDPVKRSASLKKWNASSNAYKAKQKWKEQNPKWAWVVSAVGGARARAKRAGLPFDLTNEYMYERTPDACPVFGTPFVFLGMGCISDSSPSLDKLVPVLGYVQGNVAVISNKANAIKSAATWKEIQMVAYWLRRTAESS